MQAEIISIGNELLIGQVIDTNSNWIAKSLNNIGVSVHQIRVIQDESDQIINAIEKAEKEADIIIITGGLGPTKDDITKEVVTTYFEDVLVHHKETEERIRMMFEKINYPFTKLNAMQAMVPSKCEPLENKWGTAPGMWFNEDSKIVVVLPGVPNEMKGIMQESVLPKLKARFRLPTIIHKTVLTYGMGESMVAERLETWEKNLPEKIDLAYLPSYGRVRLRLSAKGENAVELHALIDHEIAKLFELIEDIIVGFEEEGGIESYVGKLLKAKKETLAVAESCTGGKIAHLITTVPGSSAYFSGGIVAYEAGIKSSELEVSQALIASHSVVSKEVAIAMAQGIRKKFNTDYGIATTGNAGPTTDNTAAEVGTVFIAVSSRNGAYCERFFFGKPRQKVIDRASVKALEMLKKEILKNK